MKKKGVEATSFIGGADGPTSIFLIGRDNKNITWKQRIQRARNKARRKRIMKSLKADAHTMDEVSGYVMNELGYRETDKSDSQYQEEYGQMRSSFLIQYQPDLLGELSNAPKLESHDEESLKKFLEQLEKRQKAAEDIATDLFDIDLHIYTKKEKKLESSIIIEKRYEYIGGSATGSKRAMKKFNALFRKIYLYYGVTQKDIDEHSKRYEDVVRTLALR